MSSTEEKVDLRHFEIYDHNVTSEYVTYMVDLWEGDRNDPTVSVVRYIGVWLGEVLEKEDGEAFDPSFYPKDPSRYVYKNKPNNPPPLVWEVVAVVKEADQELVKFKNDQQNELGEGRLYRYGASQKRAELYQLFMNAIDTLAKWPEDEAAWKHVERWRNYNARLHEK